jgi:hypothetical protein
VSVHVQPQHGGDVLVSRRFDHGYAVTVARLRFSAAEWAEFLADVHAGQYDPRPDENRP